MGSPNTTIRIGLQESEGRIRRAWQLSVPSANIHVTELEARLRSHAL